MAVNGISATARAFLISTVSFRRWEAEGAKRSKIEVVADGVQFLGAPRSGGSAEGGGGGAQPQGGENPDDDTPF